MRYNTSMKNNKLKRNGQTGVSHDPPVPVDILDSGNVSLEDLPHLDYGTKESKRAALDCARSNGVYEGEHGLLARKEAYRQAGVKPVSRCWQQAAADLVDAINGGEVKARFDPDSRKRNTDDANVIEHLMLVGKFRKSNAREEFRWVVTQIPIPWKLIDVSLVPSDYAVSWLTLAKANSSEFMRVVAAKLIPSRLEDDGEQGFVDDGRVAELLECQIAALSVGGA